MAKRLLSNLRGTGLRAKTLNLAPKGDSLFPAVLPLKTVGVPALVLGASYTEEPDTVTASGTVSGASSGINKLGATQTFGWNAVTNPSVTVTVPSGAKLMLVIASGWSIASPSSVAMTLDGVAPLQYTGNMSPTSITVPDAAEMMGAWVNPTAGSKTLALSGWSSSFESSWIGVLFFDGDVDTTTPLRDYTSDQVDLNGTVSCTVDSTVNDYVLAMGFVESSVDGTPSANMTALDVVDDRGAGGGANAAYYYNLYSVTPGASTTTATYGGASTVYPALQLVSIAADTGGAVTGTASITEGADTGSGTGTVSIGASGSATEAADTVSATGTVTVQGTATVTEAGDTGAGTATVAVTGTAGITESPDTLTGAGTVTDPGLNGTANITEAGDTGSGTATVTVSGSGTATEAPDTATATCSVGIFGSAAITEGGDTASSAASVVVSGSAGITEAPDTATSTAGTAVTGTLGVTEAPDTLTSTADVLGSSVLGTANVTEAPDTASGTAELGPVPEPEAPVTYYGSGKKAHSDDIERKVREKYDAIERAREKIRKRIEDAAKAKPESAKTAEKQASKAISEVKSKPNEPPTPDNVVVATPQQPKLGPIQNPMALREAAQAAERAAMERANQEREEEEAVMAAIAALLLEDA